MFDWIESQFFFEDGESFLPVGPAEKQRERLLPAKTASASNRCRQYDIVEDMTGWGITITIFICPLGPRVRPRPAPETLWGSESFLPRARAALCIRGRPAPLRRPCCRCRNFFRTPDMNNPHMYTFSSYRYIRERFVSITGIKIRSTFRETLSAPEGLFGFTVSVLFVLRYEFLIYDLRTACDPSRVLFWLCEKKKDAQKFRRKYNWLLYSLIKENWLNAKIEPRASWCVSISDSPEEFLFKKNCFKNIKRIKNI